MKKKKVLCLALLLAAVLIGLLLYFHRNDRREFRNVILIGWDGVSRESLKKLLDENRLPNFSKVMKEGCFIHTFITTSLTETKPGWTEILTGYGPDVTGVYDNRVRYGAIPKGLTIFERLESHFGKDRIVTIFLSGKLQNLGCRGKHKVWPGGPRKTWHDEKLWTKEDMKNPEIPSTDSVVPREYLRGQKSEIMNGQLVLTHDAEPYYYVHDAVDVFENGIADTELEGKRLVELIRLNKDCLLYTSDAADE